MRPDATEFRLLGDVEAVVAGLPADIGHVRQRCVLAVLLVDVNRRVPADQLLGRAWGERLPSRPRNALYGYVSRLRHALGPVITREPGGYVLAVDAEAVDLHRFRRLVERARAAGDDEHALGLLDQALELWRGEAFGSLDTPWLSEVRESLGRQRLAAELDRTDLQLRLGQHAEVVPELATRAAAHPLDERLAGQLVLALYRCGRQADALDHYRAVRHRLADELGADPGAALQDLHQRILAADPGLSPAVPARSGVPHQLLAPTALFTGRTDHVKQLDALLADDRAVVALIVGTAGVGKTALAVHWAHQVRGRFTDGQLYVNLRGHAAARPMRPLEALAGFLRALGVPAEQVPVDLDEAAAAYRTLLTGKRVLVVLDNAHDPAQVRPLLPGSPGCLVLVTSRDRLSGLIARDDAVRVALDVLAPDESWTLLARIVGHDRLCTEPRAAAELADACAHLPLALRIAAANLIDHPRHDGIAGFVAELRANSLAGLEVDGDEQAAVRAAFDQSFTRLPADCATLFTLLGLVPGPDVTADAAAALAGVTRAVAVRLLDRLAAVHLITEHVPGRYAFHDLLRLYAAEHAARSSCDATPLYDWYVRTAVAAAELLYPEMLRLPGSAPRPFDDHAEALAWLDAERATLLAAVTHGPNPVAWRLSDALRGYLWSRMHTVDWLTIAQTSLAAARADGDQHAEAMALLSLGNLHSGLSRYRDAVGYYTRVLELTRRTGWLEGQATVLSQLGNVAWWSGRLPEAAEHFTEALALDTRTGRRANQAANLDSLGIVYRQLGRLTEAADHSSSGLALFRECGTRMGEAINLCNLSKIYHDLGRFDEALELLSDALVLHRDVGDTSNEAGTLDVLAAVHRDRGDLARALDLANSAVALTRETGERRLEADALNTLATVHERLGRHHRAIERHEHALAVARETETRYPEVEALIGLSRAHLSLHHCDQAVSCARQAVEIARLAGFGRLEARARAHLDGAAEFSRREMSSSAAPVRRTDDSTSAQPRSN